MPLTFIEDPLNWFQSRFEIPFHEYTKEHPAAIAACMDSGLIGRPGGVTGIVVPERIRGASEEKRGAGGTRDSKRRKNLSFILEAIITALGNSKIFMALLDRLFKLHQEKEIQANRKALADLRAAHEVALEQLRGELVREALRLASRLNRDELLFQRQVSTLGELIRLKEQICPERTGIAMEWIPDAVEEMAANSERIEEKLRAFRWKHAAILPKVLAEKINHAAVLCWDSREDPTVQSLEAMDEMYRLVCEIHDELYVIVHN